MISFDLNKFMSGHAFGFMLLLCRVGGVIMLFPGIGEAYVPPRSRLLFACLLCLLLLEPMLGRLPPLPASSAEMAQLIVYEIVIGVFFGTLVRTIYGTLEATGMVIGAQTGLSNATMINPALATQSPLPSAFLSVAALALIFITGVDHFLIRSIVVLYDYFPVGGALMPGDMAQTLISVTNHSFIVGIELAAPFLIMGLLLYAALGIMQRLLPSVQIFMVAMPLEIWGGLLMMSLTIAGILDLWLRYFNQAIATLFTR